ncbi:hypothetical protein PENSPDRAFT_431821 [Peniophora sp. CONT]|nr:hypothetical protein PENSPDRAFT_431821 [Peniophora sp. CONT]
MHMSTCAICLDALKSPTAFPCGHVFCFTCIESTVHKHSPLACTQCPTCRTSFPLVTVNPALLPLHLRPFFQPPFRRLYLDNHTVSPRINRASPPNSPPTLHAQASSSAPVPVRTCEGAVEIARLRAELDAVRAQGTMWQRRAELLASVVGNAVRESVHTEVQRLRREGESVRSEELTRRMHALEAAEPGLTM